MTQRRVKNAKRGGEREETARTVASALVSGPEFFRLPRPRTRDARSGVSRTAILEYGLAGCFKLIGLRKPHSQRGLVLVEAKGFLPWRQRQPQPPEIATSIGRLLTRYPDPKKLGFLIMRFSARQPFPKIVGAIKDTAGKHGLSVIRADEHDFHADMWGNVRTLLHGCGFGVAVFERIETDEPNANIGLEIGYLMAMNKPVLLLKDRTLETLPSDLAGKLYKPFDSHDPEGTIPRQFTKWLENTAIVVPTPA